MTFNELNLTTPILKALESEGYQIPTPIQAQAIPHILAGSDVMGCAQTGTGKTAAFAIPTIQLMLEKSNNQKGEKKKIRGLILTPTRELALQIGDSFRTYGKNTRLKYTVVYGGVNQRTQVDALRRGLDILVATPGRLLDLMQQGHIKLGSIEYFVLDEADRMLDMGFLPDVKRIISALPRQRQSLFFSATMTPEIMNLAGSMLQTPVKVEIEPVAATAELITEMVYHVDKKNKIKLLKDLVNEGGTIDRALVFTRTKHGADRVANDLSKSGIASMAIHGDKSQNARQKALQSFKKSNIRVLVATDVAARGIDIDDLNHVVNYDLPEMAEAYVHRIGRTGRAGASGTAIAFCHTDERRYLREIQKLTGHKISVVEGHDYPVSNSRESGSGNTETPFRKKKKSNKSFSKPKQKKWFGEVSSGKNNNSGFKPRKRKRTFRKEMAV